MRYRIKLTQKALKQLARMPRNFRDSVMKAIKERLSEDPYRFKPLVCNWKGYFRMRVGDYRIIYSIEDETITVLVVRIDVRGNVYD